VRSALVEHRALYARLQLDPIAQAEAIGHVIEVTQDLRLRRVALGPMPLLLQGFVERKRVLHALDVDARARIAVVKPGAADASG
jgi:hypothetical protein